MSTPATLFSVYVGIGLILMIFAVASRGKEKRTKGFESFGTGGGFDAGLMILIALLWPAWIVSLLGKKEPPAKP